MKKIVFADTNLFLRYLTNDDLKQANAVERVLDRAKNGELVLFTHPLIIAEIIWALSKVYHLDRHAIRRRILAIINTAGIRVESEHLVTQALDLHVNKNIDFIDAYSIHWMKAQDIETAYTFDQRHFSRASDIMVKVPD